VESTAAPGEASPGGSRILRHPARGRQWEPAATGDRETTTAIEEHIARHFGAPETGGAVDYRSEHDEQAMTVLGLSSQRIRTHLAALMRA
jgi:hypothetical protein